MKLYEGQKGGQKLLYLYHFDFQHFKSLKNHTFDLGKV